MPTVKDVIELMETIAPPWMAAEGDVNGLAAGDRSSRVKRILVALDASLAVAEEARARKAQMLVVHHPRFYRGLPNLDTAQHAGRLAYAFIKSNLAVYGAHTNLDAAPGGVNDCLAEAVGLRDTAVVSPTAIDPALKLVTFVPEESLETVHGALSDGGAGNIGEYSECSFRLAGTGTFRGSDASTPVIGKAGRLESVEEVRLEMVLTQSQRPAVVAALQASHPYEETAYDLYPLEGGVTYGIGRAGTLARSSQLGSLAKRLKKTLKATGIQVLGDRSRSVTTAVSWGGSGVPIPTILEMKPDVLIAGEIGYHDTELLQEAGVAAIILGHGPSEAVALPSLAASLEAGLDGVEVGVSETPVLQTYTV